ncbi:DUF6154 family protein [Aquibacillus salsiterrae]|uniref:DUF6154 family protein n=1 Tax=Aquibacillus salsiterrae TaxID=2950439 RepID=A0A9X3WGM1_9BACI|nr:DUF6154 family protein [Aquibacillus salsiterrae]MDC3418278.1 DUF6154 family protein [Aquibacillus salsiterrae]
MNFSDELFELYLQHFENDERESLQLFVQSILEQMDQHAIEKIIKSYSKGELSEMLTNHISNDIEEKLKGTSSFKWSV